MGCMHLTSDGRSFDALKLRSAEQNCRWQPACEHQALPRPHRLHDFETALPSSQPRLS